MDTKNIEIEKLKFFVKGYDVEEIHELSESIKKHGVITPILVKINSDYEYEVVDGNRRVMAAKLAGLDKIQCVIQNPELDEFVRLKEMLTHFDDRDKIMYIITQYAIDFGNVTFCPLTKNEIRHFTKITLKSFNTIWKELVSTGSLLEISRGRWWINSDEYKRIRNIALDNLTFSFDFAEGELI